MKAETLLFSGLCVFIMKADAHLNSYIATNNKEVARQLVFIITIIYYCYHCTFILLLL